MATINLPPDFKEFLPLPNDKSVEYLVGGCAVASHGSLRPNADNWKINKAASGQFKDLNDSQNLP